jgi:hypothetical protein
VEIHCLHHRRGIEAVGFEIEMCDLGEGVHSGVGPSCPDDLDRLAGEGLYGLLERLLD